MRAMKDSGVEWIGEIPDEWLISKIKRHFAVVCGATPSDDPENWAGEIPWIGPADMQDWGSISGGARSLTAKGYESCGTALVPAGSVILSTRAPIGKIQIATQDLCTNQGCKALVRKCKQTDIKYLAYYLFAIREQLEEAGTGTTFRELATSALKNMFFLLPPPAEQQRIAAYLDEQCGEIDKVLAKTRESIEEYKKLKQSVITEAVTKGIHPNRPMKPSGIEWIGDIPTEWVTVPLKRVAKIETGNTPSKKETTHFSNESGYLWVKAENLGTSKPIEKTAEYLTEEGILSGRIFPPHTVFVCCIASVGKVGFCDIAASCNQQINALIFNNAHWKYGFYLTIAQEKEYILNASGNVIKIINSETQSHLMCPLPAWDEQREIAAYLDQRCAEIDRLIAKKEQIISELEGYKKSLIYECVTGKREVE